MITSTFQSVERSSESGYWKRLSSGNAAMVALFGGLSLLVVFVFFRMHQLGRDALRTREHSLLEEKREFLPTWRFRLNPLILGEERLTACLSGDSFQMDARSIERITRRFDAEFPNRILYAVWDFSGRLARNKHIPDEVLPTMRRFLSNLAGIDEFAGMSEVELAAPRLALFTELFGESPFRRGVEATRTRVYVGQFHNENGLILIGGGLKGKGGVFAFVPTAGLTERWILRVLRSGFPGLPGKLVMGNLAEVAGSAAIPDELREPLLMNLKKSSEGVFQHQDWQVGFLRFFLPPGQIALYLVFAEKIPAPGFSGGFSWIIFWGTGFTMCLILAGLFYSGFWRTLPMNLTTKFALFLLMACFLPTMGLSWMIIAWEQMEGNLRRIQAFEEIGNHLDKVSLESEIQLSVLNSEIKNFLDPAKWQRDSFPGNEAVASRVAVLASKIDPYSLCLFHETREDLFKYHYGINGKKKIISLWSWLMAVLEGIKFPVAGKLGEMTRVQGTQLLETFQLVMGRPAFFDLIRKQGGLLPFGIFGDVNWIYFQLFPSTATSDGYGFYGALQRRSLQKTMLERYLKEFRYQPRGFPSMVFLSTHPDLKSFFPWRARHWPSEWPMLYQIMARLAQEGGTQSVSLQIAGKRVHCLAKPIRGLDVIGMGFVVEKTSAEERLTRNLFLAAAMFPAIVGLLVGLLFNTFYIRPIRTLRKAVNRMAAGDYEMYSPVLTDDEIGVLCESFNRTTQGLKEKEYLGRFISDMTRDLVKTEGAEKLPAATSLGETPGSVSGTRANATVMFSDIRGFTTFSETLPPEEVVAMLNSYLTRMEEIIEAHGGTIDKFIGDAIMAIFMPALGHADPARRAVQAGLGMQKSLLEFNAEREKAGLFTIRCGVGVATGEILMGILGREGGSRNFTVIGPTVNRSAQMEKASKYAQETFVVVCDESRKRLGAEYRFQPISSESVSLPAFEVIPRSK